MKQFLVAAMLLLGSKVAGAFTLEELLEKTIENNPAIQAARAGVEEALGHRLIFHSVALPDATIGVAGGVQGGHRAGEKPTQPFGFGYGNLSQPLFNLAVPPSWRRGDIEPLIAQQRLNVTVIEQLQAARVAFYTALYNRALASQLAAQRGRLQNISASQQSRYQSGLVNRGAFIAAQVQVGGLNPGIEAAHRAYEGAVLKMGEAIGQDLARFTARIEPEGTLAHTAVEVSPDRALPAALRRPDLELARLLIRAAREDQRIMEASYYPSINATVSGEYIPVSGVRRDQGQGTPRRSDDIISSEIRAGAAYTWRVIDNGKISGAVTKQRAAREVNELLLQKMERDVPRDLARIDNELRAIARKEKALVGASSAAEENASTLQKNLEGGIATQLESQLAESDLLQVKTALLTLAYQRSLALAQWDRATGRYLQFSDVAARKEK
ncbi:MAG: TolC family protein [Verrucomicrobiota bacterium]